MQQRVAQFDDAERQEQQEWKGQRELGQALSTLRAGSIAACAMTHGKRLSFFRADSTRSRTSPSGNHGRSTGVNRFHPLQRELRCRNPVRAWTAVNSDRADRRDTDVRRSVC